ncbi:MAG: LptF/LptG family permease [Candidatus Adiutrix sp.]|jgi:lipopolysaccharide export system permease protein|nr:LptF/LptG family permease [Candidatus Adiutrix sp.]
MSIVSRYMVVTFLRIWFMTLAGFIVFYTSVDFVEKIDAFLAKNIPLETILLYFTMQLPKIVVLMTPVATLVATLITLSILARASEIIAFKAGGVSLYRLSSPLLAVAGLICLFVFILSDMAAPHTTAVANYIWQGQVKERLDTSTVVRDVWLKAIKQMQHLDSYDEADGSITGATLVFMNDDMDLSRRLEAESGRYVDGQLRLNHVLEKIYTRPTDGRPEFFVLKRHQTLVLADWPPPPPGFGRTDQDSDELSVAQLWRTIDRLAAEGFGPVRQRVDLQFKFSFALLPLIMLAVGLPIGFWKERGGSVPLGLSLGLALSFVYLITMELAKSLGYAALLPPPVAAWLPNMIFLLFGAYLFSYVRQ